MAGKRRFAIIAEAGEQFDIPAAIRLLMWGTCAMLALGLAVWAGRSDLGAKRASAAALAMTSPPNDPSAALADVQQRAANIERDNQQLLEAMRVLISDRDRLAVRVGAIERTLGDLTGSITRGGFSHETKPPAADLTQGPPTPPATDAVEAAAPKAAAKPPTVPPPAAIAANKPAAAPVVAAPVVAAPSAAAPVAAAPAAAALPVAVAAATPPSPPAPVAAVPAAAPAAAAPAPIAAVVPPVAAAAPARTAEAPIAKPAEAPEKIAETPSAPQPAAGGPGQAATTLAAIAPAPTTTSSAISAPAVRSDAGLPAGSANASASELGVDLGPALSLNRLRSRWNSLRNVYGTLFEGLRPVVAIRENGKGWPLEMHLIVGPFVNAGVATQFCSAIARTQYICQSVAFDGQRLVMR